MNKSDFVFTVGYTGSTAVINRRLQARFQKLNTIQLYEKGLIGQAVASALYEQEHGNGDDLEQLLERFRMDFDEELDEQKLRRVYGIASTVSEGAENEA